MQDKKTKYVLSPQDYIKLINLNKAPKINETVILTFNTDVFETLKSCVLENDIIDASVNYKHGRKDNFIFTKNNNKYRVLLAGDGAANVAFALEICIARGARCIFGIGFTMALTDELNIGEYFMPLQVINEAGVVKYYTDKKNKSLLDRKRNNKNTNKINQKINCLSGLSYCVDGFFKVNTDDLNYAIAKGAKTMDMESGAFYAVADYYNIPALLLNIVSESIYENWEVDYKKSREALKSFYKNEFEILMDYINGRFKENVC